jgi:hypothetical protein
MFFLSSHERDLIRDGNNKQKYMCNKFIILLALHTYKMVMYKRLIKVMGGIFGHVMPNQLRNTKPRSRYRWLSAVREACGPQDGPNVLLGLSLMCTVTYFCLEFTDETISVLHVEKGWKILIFIAKNHT